MNDTYLSRIVDDFSIQFQRHLQTTNQQNIIQDDKMAWLRTGNSIRNTRNILTNRYRRPSLQSRLQDGNNLQLCFLNQPSAEGENNQSEDGVPSLPSFQSACLLNNTDIGLMPINNSHEVCDNIVTYLPADSKFSAGRTKHDANNNRNRNFNELHNEVCNSLNKIYADSDHRVEFTFKRRSDSPITCTIKTCLKKVGVNNGDDYNGRRRMSRQMLTKLNSYQLQTIIDDLHVHVEFLNEQLMKMLMERDELHMSRDSLLVDIEDITAYLNAKQVYRTTNFQNTVYRENYSSNYGIFDPVISKASTKNKQVPSRLRFNQLTSYIRN